MSSISDTATDDTGTITYLGYKQELKRHHNVWSLLGYAFITLNTWTALAASLNLALPAGGPSAVLWGLVVSGIGCTCLAASMAEFASVYPTAAGQYYWVALVAPPKWAQVLSWSCGWINVVGWAFIVGTGASFAEQMILNIQSLMQPSGFVAKPWQHFLMYLANMTLSFCMNVFANGILPHLNKAALVWSISGLFVVMTAVLSCAAPKFRSAGEVFSGVFNDTKWPTGVAWSMGLLQGTLCLLGYDSPARMSEEIPNPRKNVPRTMIGCVVLGTVSGFIFCLSLLLVAPNYHLVTQASEGPLLFILRYATKSRAAAVVLSMFPLGCILICTVMLMTSASRLLWAFARDGGLPFSGWISQVHPTLKIPLNSIIASFVVTTLYGALNFAGASAISAIVSSATVTMGLANAFPIFVNMCRGRKGLPENRDFKLSEPVAWVLNSVGMVYTSFTTVLFLFPPTGPKVTASNMNYAIVPLALMGIISAIDYNLNGKTRYQTPKLQSSNEMEEFNEDK
ncbi:amino acid/polyamine transporter I [Pyronema omphalodes]|nr:amino acid/polyamine transporter I [Pyronema omphalodes]